MDVIAIITYNERFSIFKLKRVNDDCVIWKKTLNMPVYYIREFLRDNPGVVELSQRPVLSNYEICEDYVKFYESDLEVDDPLDPKETATNEHLRHPTNNI